MDTAVYSAFCGSLGATMAMAFTALGAAYGTAKSGTGIAGMAVARPDLIMKSILPVVMSSVIAIYGLVVSVLIVDDIHEPKEYGLFKGFNGMFAGVSCGVAGLAAGYAIGIVGDTGVRGVAQEPKMFVGMILVLIFAEVLGLYGLIIAIIMVSKS